MRASSSGGTTIGVRHSTHPVAQMLVSRFGRPLTSTSANRSGEPPAVDAASARRIFGGEVDEIVDGGPAPGGTGSTVVDVSGTRAVLVRAGALAASAIECAGFELDRAGA